MPLAAILLALFAPNFNWFIPIVGLLLFFLLGFRVLSLGLFLILLLSVSPLKDAPSGVLLGRVLTASLWLQSLSHSKYFQGMLQRLSLRYPEIGTFSFHGALVREDFTKGLEHARFKSYLPFMRRMVPIFVISFYRSFLRLVGCEEVRLQREAHPSGSGPIRVKQARLEIKERVLLDALDFEVQEGETLVCYGDVGSGKTTLLRALAGFTPFSAGVIERGGVRLSLDGKGIRLSQSIVWVSQNPSFQLTGATPEEELQAALHSRADKGEDVDWLEWSGLSACRHRPTLELSFGEQKKLVLVSALASGAHTLLLDEPTAGLSRRSAQNFLECLEKLRTVRPLTIVWATHDLSNVPQSATRILTLKEGKARVQILSSFLKGNHHV